MTAADDAGTSVGPPTTGATGGRAGDSGTTGGRTGGSGTTGSTGDRAAPPVPPAPAAPATRATGRRRAILVVLGLALAALLTGAPQWLRTAGTTALQGEVPVAVAGAQAAPGVPAAALVLLAAGVAIGLAGRIGRWVVVAVVALAGVLLTASAVAVATDPRPVAGSAVADVTGVETLSAAVELTPWPWVAAAVGVLVVLAGGWLALTSRQWARPSDRHDPTSARGPAPVVVVHDDDQAAWDALTRGHDPT